MKLQTNPVILPTVYVTSALDFSSLLLQYKSNIYPVWGNCGAVQGLFYRPTFFQVFVDVADIVCRMPVGGRLFVNINIYSYYFLRHVVLF